MREKEENKKVYEKDDVDMKNIDKLFIFECLVWRIKRDFGYYWFSKHERGLMTIVHENYAFPKIAFGRSFSHMY